MQGKNFRRRQRAYKSPSEYLQTDDGDEDQKKATQLLEIYVLEIQMYTEQKNNKALQQLYVQSLHIKGGIPHPLIMGTIRECDGKMHLRNEEFTLAHTDFFEAFKNYDESGSPRRISCLQYFLLVGALINNDSEPILAEQAAALRDDPAIVVTTQLVEAFEASDMVLN